MLPVMLDRSLVIGAYRALPLIGNRPAKAGMGERISAAILGARDWK